jgi:carbon storage regulator
LDSRLGLGSFYRAEASGYPSQPSGRHIRMLVLTRKSNQSIMIGDDIEVSVLAIVGEKVRIGIQAPRDVPVFRKEVYLEIQDEHRNGVKPEDVVAEVDAALHELGETAEK